MIIQLLNIDLIISHYPPALETANSIKK